MEVSANSFVSIMRKLDLDNAYEIAELLNKKYEAVFDVKAIGNRLASDRVDKVKAYCCPKDNEDLLFEAVMNVERELVSDDYPACLVEAQAKEIIEKAFEGKGIRAFADVSVSRVPFDETMVGMKLCDVIGSFPTLSLTFTTIMCEGADARDAYDTVVSLLGEFYSGNPDMLLGTTIWKYNDEAYEECCRKAKSVPSINMTALEKQNPTAKVTVAFVNGAVNTDFEGFEKSFK